MDAGSLGSPQGSPRTRSTIPAPAAPVWGVGVAPGGPDPHLLSRSVVTGVHDPLASALSDPHIYTHQKGVPYATHTAHRGHAVAPLTPHIHVHAHAHVHVSTHESICACTGHSAYEREGSATVFDSINELAHVLGPFFLMHFLRKVCQTIYLPLCRARPTALAKV